jgi:hypothetical protein
MGNPKAARRSYCKMLRNSRSESLDRVTTLVDFGAHLLWSPPHSFAESLCSKSVCKVWSSVALVNRCHKRIAAWYGWAAFNLYSPPALQLVHSTVQLVRGGSQLRSSK